MQTTNAAGIELIKGYETFQAKAYKLAGESYYTIGYGHTYDNSITKDTVWTIAYATEVFKKDLQVYEKHVRELATQYKFKFNDNQFSALVSYCYNRGRGGLNELLSNSKNKNEVGVNIVIYWGKPSAIQYKTGLVRRRKSEQELYFKTPLISKVSNSTSNDKLVVDGYWGNSLTEALQKSLGTYQDGYITGQYKNDVTKNITGVKYGTTGSDMIKALQKKLKLKQDGFLGAETIKALQKHLKTPVDGKLSKPSTMVKELQKRLNNNTF